MYVSDVSRENSFFSRLRALGKGIKGKPQIYGIISLRRGAAVKRSLINAALPILATITTLKISTLSEDCNVIGFL